MMKKGFTPLERKRNSKDNCSSLTGFTLLELVVVIIILGVLATLGITQYGNMVERSRLAEAIDNIKHMRELAYKYYIEHGSLSGLQGSDVDANNPWVCDSGHYFSYLQQYNNGTTISLVAIRCAPGCGTGGKAPDASRCYYFSLRYTPSTGESVWHCFYPNNDSPCFGYAGGWY